MRAGLVLDALVAAMIDGDGDPGAVVARCSTSLVAVDPFVLETIRDLATRIDLGRATAENARRALEGVFEQRWHECPPADFEDAEELEDEVEPGDAAPAPPSLTLTAFLRAKPRCVVRRLHLPISRPNPANPSAPATIGELAERLACDPRSLDAFASPRPAEDERYAHHRSRWVQKRSGGMRLLEIPKPRLLAIQRRVLVRLLAPLAPHAAAHGFVRGRSPRTHGALHAGNETVLLFDLEDFFGSIGRARVAGILRASGWNDPVARTIARICTVRTPAHCVAEASLPQAARVRLRTPHLAQGAPTSPLLANLAARGLDARLDGLARRFGHTYSRYADDLAFSGDASLAHHATRFGEYVAAIVVDEGFRLNHGKTRVIGRHAQQRITGLVVNATPAVSRAERDRLEAILTNCVRRAPATQNREGHADFRAHLLGRIANVAAANARHGRALHAIFDAIVW